MRFFSALFFFALLAACTSQAAPRPPPITIPLTKRQQDRASLQGSPNANRARAALFKSPTTDGLTTVTATDVTFAQYITSVGVGSPPTYYNFIVDTGSSNILCGTGTKYVRTSTSIPTGQTVNANFGSATFRGLEYLDQVTLAPDLVITNQSIADATTFEGFGSVDGILGVGPVGLTNHSLSPDKNAVIPTVMNNLVSQGLIEKQVLGISFSPSKNLTDNDGALTYGGTDPSLYYGEVTYVPVTETQPAGRYWGINITSSTYGNHTIIPKSTAGIVDTGTTLILLANDFFNSYTNAIPGAHLDLNTGLLEIPPSSVQLMQPLTFVIGDRAFVLDAAAQLVPPDQNIQWGGVTGKQYGVVVPLGSYSGQGLDFFLGQTFMERYYAVFDTDANRVGFAFTTPNSDMFGPGWGGEHYGDVTPPSLTNALTSADTNN